MLFLLYSIRDFIHDFPNEAPLVSFLTLVPLLFLICSFFNSFAAILVTAIGLFGLSAYCVLSVDFSILKPVGIIATAIILIGQLIVPLAVCVMTVWEHLDDRYAKK